jgi:hypothetical protein
LASEWKFCAHDIALWVDAEAASTSSLLIFMIPYSGFHWTNMFVRTNMFVLTNTRVGEVDHPLRPVADNQTVGFLPAFGIRPRPYTMTLWLSFSRNFIARVKRSCGW